MRSAEFLLVFVLTLHEMTRLLQVHRSTVKAWAQHGLLRAYMYNDKAQCLYEHRGERLPVKMQGRKLSHPYRPYNIASNRTNEVGSVAVADRCGWWLPTREE